MLNGGATTLARLYPVNVDDLNICPESKRNRGKSE